MSRKRATDPVRVTIGDCECPDKPHEQDEALFRPRLLPEDAMAAVSVVTSGQSDEVITARMGMILIRGGMLSWNLLDDAGQPIPVSEVGSGAFDWDTLKPLADEASRLYGDGLLSPLVRLMDASSATGQTDASTSAN